MDEESNYFHISSEMIPVACASIISNVMLLLLVKMNYLGVSPIKN